MGDELQIQCEEVLLEDTDVATALIEYTHNAAIEHLVLGSSMKNGLLRYASLVLSHMVQPNIVQILLLTCTFSI